MKPIWGIAASLLFAVTSVASPQPGMRDAGFDSGLGSNDSVGGLLLQSDGRILISGSFTNIHGVTRANVARLNTDGSLDHSFDSGSASGLSINGTSYFIGQIAATQADGKILIRVWTQVGAGTRGSLARLNTDGSVDGTFNPPATFRAGFSDVVLYSAAVQSDGKILIGGDFSSLNGFSQRDLARLNTNGSVDSSFRVPLQANLPVAPEGVHELVVQGDGRILVRGVFSPVDGGILFLARLNPDGTPDSRLQIDSGSAFPAAMKSLPDGKLLWTGGGLWRLNADGTYDTSFNPSPGRGYEGPLALEGDGRILVGFQDPILQVTRLARLRADGMLDDGFNFIPNAGPPGLTTALAIQADGKILAAGPFGLVRLYSGEATPVAPGISKQPQHVTVGEYRNASFRVESYGFPKPTYQWQFNGADIPGETNAGLTLPKARLTNSGSYAVVISNSVDRLTSEPANLTVIPAPTAPGFLDLSFDPNVGLSSLYSFIRTVLVQHDNKVLIAAPDLFRVDQDGRIDTTFTVNLSGDAQITDVALQDDNRILICGTFTNVNGVARNRIARLRVDGRLDESFDTGAGVGGTTPGISSLAWRTNGQVLIAGTFTTVNGSTRLGVARLNANGSLDTGFDPGDVTPTSVASVKVHSDGRVLIVGGFTAINGVERPGLARLHANGSLDTDFLPAVTVRSAVDLFDVPEGLVLQPDGKIWLAGDFGTVGGQEGVNLVRLRSDGSVDVKLTRPTANFGLIPSHFSLALQPDGRLLVSSRFSPMVRLNPDGTVDSNFQATDFTRNSSQRWPMFLALGSDGLVMVAGDFTTVAGWPRPGLAQLHGGDLPQFVAGSMRRSGTGQFEFQLTSNPNQLAVIEASTTLIPAEWIPILTINIGAGPLSLTDTHAVSYPTRFYRVRVSP